MAKSGIQIKRDTVAKSMTALKKLVGLDILVGVPSTKAGRDDDAPINNAQLAYIHTYGATIQVPEHETTLYRAVDDNGDFKKNGQFVKKAKSNFATSHTVPAHEIAIPARPFLEPGIKNAEPKTLPHLREAAKQALQGDADKAEKSMQRAGLVAQNEVRAVINAGVAPPLAESTLRSRRARGRTGTVPLIDRGELRNSITYVLRKK